MHRDLGRLEGRFDAVEDRLSRSKRSSSGSTNGQRIEATEQQRKGDGLSSRWWLRQFLPGPLSSFSISGRMGEEMQPLGPIKI
jgi:hypothetical protein